MPAATPRFPAGALTFLRALKRNNDREWFKARKDVFERDLKAPMEAIIVRLDAEFRQFAPDIVADPKRSMYRMYRDTRFSEDKTPLKTHVSAYFKVRGLSKAESPGFYFHVEPSQVIVAGGLYAPQAPELAAIRRHISANHRRFRSIVEAPAYRRATGGLQGERLTRLPRGFDADDPAADYLRFKQFLAWREYPPTLATDARLLPTLLGVFRHVAPLIHFLTEPLLNRPASRDPLRSRRE